MSQQPNPLDVVAPLENGTNTIDESLPQRWYRFDDYLAMGLGALIIVVAAAASLVTRPGNLVELTQGKRCQCPLN